MSKQQLYQWGKIFPFDLEQVYVNILVILPNKIQVAANQT